jgi:Pyruvate/2-oxoacid:ferredoxin oxidoreductase delta subunit
MEDSMTDDALYRALQEHLDRLPGGFAPSKTGADLRLLRRLFEPDEAALAVHLSLEQEEASAIAARAGLPLDEAANRLETMAARGLILAHYHESEPTRYQAIPFVIGIYEAQLDRLDRRMIRELQAYWLSQVPRERPRVMPQIRTIPVGESVNAHLEALPYEQVEALIAAHETIAVSPCICRRSARIMGGGCDAPEEACFSFGEWAAYSVRHGRARAIDRDEAREILARADAANLVLQPSNSREAAFICCCCGCCCGVLQGLQHQPRPADAVASAFQATLDADACAGCWTCLDRCQMGALSMNDDHVALDQGRCIGCGLCVTTCPTGALALERRADRDPADLPATLLDTWRLIADQQEA